MAAKLGMKRVEIQFSAEELDALDLRVWNFGYSTRAAYLRDSALGGPSHDDERSQAMGWALAEATKLLATLGARVGTGEVKRKDLRSLEERLVTLTAELKANF